MKEQPLKPVQWGIIGLGKIAKKFAADVRKTKGAKLYAVASRDFEKAESFASEFGAHLSFDSYENLLKNSKVEAVYIATPHSLHFKHTMLALQYGKAVLCEKPFAMNSQEVATMIATAREQNILLMEALWTYFLPHYQFTLQQLQSQRFGKILKLEADFGFAPLIDFRSRVFKKDLGGGSLLDIGIYPIFAALSTLAKPIDIDAKAYFLENGVDESCEMVFNYDDGVKAFLKSTLVEKTPTEAIFTCEKGIVKINSRFHEPSSVTLMENGKEETFTFDTKTIGYSYEIEHFNELFRNGITESPVMTHQMSKDLIELLDKVRQLIGLDYSTTR